jgi:hypothetical protein
MYGLGQGTTIVATTGVSAYGPQAVSSGINTIKNKLPRTLKGSLYNGDLFRTPDQQALADLAKEAVRKSKSGKPITYQEAQLLDEWAVEYSVPQHHGAEIGSGDHFPGGNFQDHTHIYNYHVPFK